MPRMGRADEAGRLHARVDVAGSGEASVATGVPVLDHLLALLAQYAVEVWSSDVDAGVHPPGLVRLTQPPSH